MSFQCNFCRKKPFEKENSLSNHIRCAHYHLIRQVLERRNKNKQHLKTFASRITQLPDKLTIPLEYLADFTNDIIWDSHPLKPES